MTVLPNTTTTTTTRLEEEKAGGRNGSNNDNDDDGGVVMDGTITAAASVGNSNNNRDMNHQSSSMVAHGDDDDKNDPESGSFPNKANNNNKHNHQYSNDDARTATHVMDSSSETADVGYAWTPAHAAFPEENIEEKFPLLTSLVAMREVKGYVNGENLVPTTTYSFIVSTSGRAPTLNLVNLVVFVLQMASFVAVITSIFDFDNVYNPCQIPANVESSVRASQFLSLVYSICVQGGVISSLYTFRNGYDEEMLRKSFPDCAKHPIALRIRWYIAVGLILFMGLVAQGLTFVLIMQSSTVLGVLLNYAAVTFVSTIDDRMFYLGKRGWLGQEVEKQVRLVRLADEVDPKPTWYNRLAHTMMLLLIFGSLVVSWVIVVSRQTNGEYLPHKIYINFDDESNAALGTFNGIFHIDYTRHRVFSSDRSLYTESRSRRAHFGYCETSRSWAFQYGVTKENFDACAWSAVSSPTETFDIVTTALSQWFAKNTDDRIIPMKHASIAAADCSSDQSLCGKHGSCGRNGDCVCDEGWLGLFCQFREPCPTLELDARRTDALGSSERRWSTRYEILRFGDKTALIYDHPVYVTETRPPGKVAAGLEKRYDIIYYTGKRWAISFASEFMPPGYSGDFESYISTFHAHFSNYQATFLSEPITPILQSLSPIGIRWYFADFPQDGMQSATTQVLDAGFVCAECSEEHNPCYYDGVCGDLGLCECSEGSSGSLCENPPVGNGRCDPWFNRLQFNMDGGDCCRATCISSPDYICGTDETGFLATGFTFCESSDALRTESINGKPLAEIGTHISLSENGYLMAAAKKKKDVTIFDKSGALWNERFVLKACDTEIRSLDMSSGPFVSNPFVTEPPFILAVTCRDSSEALLYYCREGDDCDTHRLGKPDEADSSFGTQISVSSDGGVVAISSNGDGPGSSLVKIFRATLSDEYGVKWIDGGLNDVIVPIKYQKNPINGTLRLSLQQEDFNATLEQDVSFPVDETPKPQFISSFSLSNSNTLAIAASDTRESMLNQIHYYQWNGTTWEELGTPIEARRCPDFTKEDMVQLSDDGSILLTSDGSKVNVYRWNEDNDDWTLRGTPIQQNECSIYAVTLAPSGSEIAINTIIQGEEADDFSRILTFNWSDSDWQQRENADDSIQFSGNSTLKLAFSFHGRELAIGRPHFPADLSGRVQTYEYPRSSCGNGRKRLRITMTIQPDVTKWTLTSLLEDDTFVSTAGGPYYFPNFAGAEDASETHHDGATVVEEVCIPDTRCGNFSLYPPAFGGAALILDRETRLQLEDNVVFHTWIGSSADNLGECDLLVDMARRRKRSIDSMVFNGTADYDDDLFFGNGTDYEEANYEDDSSN